MPDKPLKIALVGAGTLLGKALNDQLALSSFASADLHLLDDEESAGQLAASADEITLVQQIEPESFDGCDFTFFAGSEELTRKHWRQALKSGSRIVDLSRQLEGVPDVLVRAPWIQDETAGFATTTPPMPAAPDLQTRIVVSAHPVAVLLALLAGRARKIGPLHGLWATLLQPASEYGHAALEELHRQTANLLSFQPMPMEVFGVQAAFSLAISIGPKDRVMLADAAAAIQRHYATIVPATASVPALQLIQAPVFHGYFLSIAVEFDQPIPADTLARALAGPHVRVVPSAADFPGNVQTVEEEDVQVLVRPVLPDSKARAASSSGSHSTGRFWLWSVADNLKLAAQNAIACAIELNRLRPRGTVQ